MLRPWLRLVGCIALMALAGGFQPAASAVSPPPKTQPLPSAEALFARHRDAMGKLPALSARWSGTITVDDQATRYEISADRQGRFRRIFKLSLFNRSEGSNGTLDWEQDENGNVQSLPAEHHPPMDARLVRLNDVKFDSRNSFVVGITQLEGHRVYSVSTLVNTRPATIYFDVGSSLIAGADFGDTSLRYRAYRHFSGVAVPSEITEIGGEGRLTITVDSCDFRATPLEMFEPPAQKEPKFPSGAHEVAINFDSPRGLVVLPGQINGHTVKLLLDSGSTTSLIDADLAKRLGLETGGVARVQGAGLLTGTTAKVDSLSIGGIVFEPFFMEAVPLRLPSRIGHEGIEGILGYDVLAALVARLSYRKDEVRFQLPETFSYSGNGSTLALDLSKRVPLITASLGMADRGTFTVDTGSDAKLVLYRHFAESNRRDFVDPYQYDQDFGSGAGGDFPTRLAIITRLNLGAYSLPDIVTQIVMREAGAFGPTSSDGIVGSGALATFDAVFLDYSRKRIILEK